MTDWKDCTAIQSKDGRIWIQASDDPGIWVNDRGGEWDSRWIEDEQGPITPRLDKAGNPVVSTVGDLTARHLHKRVVVSDPPGTYQHGPCVGELISVTHHDCGRSDVQWGGWKMSLYADTPCEVLE